MQEKQQVQEHSSLGKSLGKSFWAVVIVFGFTGQIAWMVENMYLNVFLYNTISTDPNRIATMVAASALVATLTTILMGAFSDRIGKRKIFLVLGYILWGVTIWSFSWIEVAQVEVLFPKLKDSIAFTAGLLILMDCVMTFFGSSANDAAFHAYVTDSTEMKNRARVEAVLTAFPLFAMLLIFGLLDPLTQAGEWKKFFFIIGLITILSGILGIFLIPKEKPHPSKDSWIENILYGFRPSTIRSQKKLYFALLILLVVSIAAQVYMPYLLIYLQNYLQFTNYVPMLAIVLLGSAVITILGGRLADRHGKMQMFPFYFILAVIGLLLMFFSRSYLFTTIAALVFMSGSLLLTTLAGAWVKDEIPEHMAGRFQGVRMIFAVLLPMLIGPFVGSMVIHNSGKSYVELGVEKQVPSPEIFLAAAIILLFVIIPWIVYKKNDREKILMHPQ